MTTLRSCHLIVNRKLTDDHRHVHHFIDTDFFSWGGISTLFLGCTPSTDAKICSRSYTHFGKTLNISNASDSTFTVLIRWTSVVVKLCIALVLWSFGPLAL